MLMVYLPMQPSSLYDFVGSDDGVTPRLQGQTTAVELPADAGGYVGVVPWQRLSWHNVTLPPNVGSRWPQVLESLLEEDLLQPPQQVHLVCGPGSALALRQGGHVVVCACDKPWLRSVLEPLQMAGKRISRLVPELQPVSPGSMPTIYWVNHLGQPHAVCCSTDSVCPLPSAVAHEKGDATAFEIFVEPSVAQHASQTLEQPPLLLTQAARWLRAGQSEWDLAQHEWAQHWRLRSQRWLVEGLRHLWFAPAWRSSRQALLALLTVQLIGWNIGAWHDHMQQTNKQEALARMLQTTVPSVSVVIDPVQQMQRALALRQQESSALLADDLSVMLDLLSTHWPAHTPIERIDFEKGELTLQVSPAHTLPHPLPPALMGYRWQVQGQKAVMRKHSEPVHAQLDPQIAQMQSMQQQWHALDKYTSPSTQVSLQALQQHVKTLGERASARHVDKQFQLEFKDLSSQALAQFLVQSSEQSQARLSEAHWQSVNGQWRGECVFILPGGH